MHWGALLVFALLNAAFAFAAWRRAGRAAKLAEDANARAIIADARAEEAHTLLKERSATEKERAQAEIEAPPIADKWRAQISISAQKAQASFGRLDRNRRGHTVLPITTLAEHIALRIIRAESAELGIVELVQVGGQARVSVMTPYQLTQKRARERR